MTTHTDHLGYVQHVLGSIYMSFMGFGCVCVRAGGLPRQRYTMCFCRFLPPTPCSSKVEVSEIDFFDAVTTHHDHPSYVTHILGRIYVLFTSFGYSKKSFGCALLGVDSLRIGLAESN